MSKFQMVSQFLLASVASLYFGETTLMPGNNREFAYGSTHAAPTYRIQPPRHPSNHDLSIDHLRLGESSRDVVKTYGQPDLKTLAHGIGTPEWVYKRYGLYVYFEHINGHIGPIWQIEVTSPFRGKTYRGIHIGSTKKDVIKAYPGIQFRTRKQFGDETAVYSIDSKHEIEFGLNHSGRVFSIWLTTF